MPEIEGAADALMIADPTTFRVLPWAAKTGWLFCDLHFSNGQPVPSRPGGSLAGARRLGARGYGFVAGLEVEFHVFQADGCADGARRCRPPGSPPAVGLRHTATSS